jgi:hypothetical protein
LGYTIDHGAHTAPQVHQHAPELFPGWKTLENPGIWELVPLAVPMALPFTGGAVVPGSVPAPLTDNEPGPVHGSPVSGFVPVVLGRSPVGSAGETGFSGVAGKSGLLVLGGGRGLKVIPFCSVVAGFCCASATVAVAVRTRTLRPISPMRSVDMRRLLSASPPKHSFLKR